MKLKTGTKAWKVVTEKRESLIPLLLKDHLLSEDSRRIIKKLKRLRVTKIYFAGSIYKAAKDMEPILCFRSRAGAEAWRRDFPPALGSTKIIKVIGYEPREPCLRRFTREQWDILLTTPLLPRRRFFLPTNTIGFRRVRIIT